MFSTVEYFDKQTSALHAIAGQNHLFGCFNTFFHYKPKKKKNCKNTQKKGSTRVGACWHPNPGRLLEKNCFFLILHEKTWILGVIVCSFAKLLLVQCRFEGSLCHNPTKGFLLFIIYQFLILKQRKHRKSFYSFIQWFYTTLCFCTA